MQTLTRETHTSDHAAPPRRWLLPVIAALVLLVVAGGVWAIIAANQTDDQSVATELVDTWIRGFNEQDEDAIRSVFTADAVIDGNTVEEHLRRAMAGTTTNVSLVDEVTPVDDEGTYAFVMEFDWGGNRYSGDWEVELEDDLLARADLTEEYTQVGS